MEICNNIGVKLTLLGGRLDGTFALFQLDKDNVLASDTGNPGFSVAIGKACNRGIKFDLAGKPLDDIDVGGRTASLGAGVQYVGERSGETGTAFTLPAHTLVRLFGEVEIMDGMTLFGAVQNQFDALSYAKSYAPLWVQLSVFEHRSLADMRKSAAC